MPYPQRRGAAFQSHLGRPKFPRPRKRRRAVTAIAIIECVDGVVQCGDTREEAGDVSYPVDKLADYGSDRCTVGFAGSGDNGRIIDAVVDRIKSALDWRNPDNAIAIKDTISGALTDIYKHQLDYFPQPPNDEPIDTTVDLLLAVKGINDERVTMLVSTGNVIAPVQGLFDMSGSALRMRFILQRYGRDDLSLLEGVLLCSYMLALARRHGVSVGGESHIQVSRHTGIGHPGWIQRARLVETELSEEYFQKFDQELGGIFLPYADTTLTSAEFDQKFDARVGRIKEFRREYEEQFRALVMGLVNTNPNFKDAYQKLTDGTRVVFEDVAWRYRWLDGGGGYSGVPEPSPAPPEDDSQESG
jgi:hypothetical protein